MIALAALYLLVANVLTFAVFASDKRRAMAGDRRVPERNLLQLVAVGGTVGALAAQQILRHKTKKEPFRSLLWLIAVLQIALGIWAAVWLIG
ncbi:DUF1294 domain-containing protein [Caulobacter segnis]